MTISNFGGRHIEPPSAPAEVLTPAVVLGNPVICVECDSWINKGEHGMLTRFGWEHPVCWQARQ